MRVTAKGAWRICGLATGARVKWWASSSATVTVSEVAVKPGAEAVSSQVCAPSAIMSSRMVSGKVAEVRPAGMTTEAGTVSTDAFPEARVTVSGVAKVPESWSVAVRPTPPS